MESLFSLVLHMICSVQKSSIKLQLWLSITLPLLYSANILIMLFASIATSITQREIQHSNLDLLDFDSVYNRVEQWRCGIVQHYMAAWGSPPTKPLNHGQVSHRYVEKQHNRGVKCTSLEGLRHLTLGTIDNIFQGISP